MRADDGVDLSVRGMLALRTLVEEGHFGRAAARLWVSTPALSQQIRRLETQVGARLVDRSTVPIGLTAAGEAFLPHLRQALLSMRDGLAAVERVEPHTAGRLRVGFVNGGVGPVWSSIMARLTGPVEFTLLSWTDQVAAVAQGTVDASVIRSPLVAAPNTRLEPLTVEPRVAVVHRRHRLAGRRSVSIDELDDEVHVDTPHMDDAWKAFWTVDPRPSGAEVRYGPAVTNIDEMLQVVSAGLAVAITGDTIRHVYAGADVDFLEVSDISPSRIELCTRIDDPNPRVDELRRVVASHRPGGSEGRPGSGGTAQDARQPSASA